MWRCEWCGAIFPEPEAIPAGLFMFNKMVELVCPECGETDIIETEDDNENV